MKPKIILKNLDKERRGCTVDRMAGSDAQPQAVGGGDTLKIVAIFTSSKLFSIPEIKVVVSSFFCQMCLFKAKKCQHYRCYPMIFHNRLQRKKRVSIVHLERGCGGGTGSNYRAESVCLFKIRFGCHYFHTLEDGWDHPP